MSARRTRDVTSGGGGNTGLTSPARAGLHTPPEWNTSFWDSPHISGRSPPLRVGVSRAAMPCCGVDETSLPPDPGSTRVTRLLERLDAGDAVAADQLFVEVYGDLRRLAGAAIAREAPGHTLQATALVSEAWLKLARGGVGPVEGRRHFLAVAARAMRQVLVDYARRRHAERRGGALVRVTLSRAQVAERELDVDEVLALDEALDALEAMDSRLRQIVELRFFTGLKDDEVAEVLGVTRRTVQREWVKARAFLNRELAAWEEP